MTVLNDVRASVLIDADRLATLLSDPARHVVLLHVGTVVGEEGIAGAVPVSLGDFAGPGGGIRGERPLPEINILQEAARRWGIGPTSHVVLYDDKGCLQAARGWWVLRWAGIADVRLLDGGLAAWRAIGGAIEPIEPIERQGTVTLSSGYLPQIDADGALAVARDGILLDARSEAAFVSGHIPGAVSAPALSNLTDGGYFADPATLRQRFAQLGVDPDSDIGISCGSGVSAAHDIAALASIGIPAALYVPSWSGWTADGQRPVVSGRYHVTMSGGARGPARDMIWTAHPGDRRFPD